MRSDPEERLYIAPLENGDARHSDARHGDARRLTDRPATVPRWSPDGRWIAFSPRRELDGGIFIIGADGRGERQIAPDGSWPAWSRDGTHVAHVRRGADDGQEIRIAAVSADRAARRVGRLTFPAGNFPLDLSPDGRQLVTTRVVPLAQEVWLLTPPSS